MKKASLLIIFISVFIDLIGFGIVLPLLPKYSYEFGARGLWIGLIYSSFSAMQFLFAPFWGRLSDRVGRRPIILLSNTGSALSYVLFALASSYGGDVGLWMLVASRVFAGICGANLSVASAYVADVSPPDQRTKGMGLIGMAFGLGFILGPALGALSFYWFGLSGPGWVGAGICSFNVVLGYFILGESRKPGSAPAPGLPKLAHWRQTLSRPVVGALIGIFFLATFCFASFESSFAVLLTERWSYNEMHIGLLLAYCGFIAALVQGGIGRLVKRLGEVRIIIVSLVLVGVSLGLLPYMSTLTGLLLALGCFAAFSGINRPPIFGLISLNTSPEEQGATLGVAQSAGSLARIIGPPFANAVYEVNFAIPYLVCTVVAILGAILAGIYLPSRRDTSRSASPTTAPATGETAG